MASSSSPPSSPEQHKLKIDVLSGLTAKKLQKLPILSTEPCIYRVRNGMRVSNERYFTPQIVSIGPIHYQNMKLRENKHLKEMYLAEFLHHTGVRLSKCYELLLDKTVEKRLRGCYAHVIELDSEDFVKMVLVDAAFLLMILVYNSTVGILAFANDKIFGKPGMISDIRYDMVLLENQLPFFILEDLYKLSNLQNIVESKSPVNFNEETAMTVFAYQFLKDFMTLKVQERHPPSKPEHILDLYRSCLIPADWNPEWKEAETSDIPGTKELCQAGVKIQVGSKENMFDIRFHDGILEVPPLHIYGGSTELVFQNLLAFELCHCRKNYILSDYIEMMRLLTLSPEDTEMLLQNGIISKPYPKAEGVTKLFDNISAGNLIWTDSRYSDVVKDLNKYYKECWHKWKATAKEKYFKFPWAICSVSAAVFLLVLTVVQTVFTILQVVLPK